MEWLLIHYLVLFDPAYPEAMSIDQEPIQTYRTRQACRRAGTHWALNKRLTIVIPEDAQILRSFDCLRVPNNRRPSR